jgi:signal transduction histidine kinase
MPFFTTRPDKKGAGLGLPTSRRIAKLYDGDLLFESKPGNTIFTLYLPVGENKAVEVKSDAR